jgi:hypothetical protein
MTIEAEATEVLIELLDEFGFRAKILRGSTGTVDPSTLRPTAATGGFLVRAVFFNPENYATGMETSLPVPYQAEMKYLIILPDGDNVVKSGDIFQPLKDDGTNDGPAIKITDVDPVGPTRDTIYYKAVSSA